MWKSPDATLQGRRYFIQDVVVHFKSVTIFNSYSELGARICPSAILRSVRSPPASRLPQSDRRPVHPQDRDQWCDRGLYDVEIVFDNHDGVPHIHQPHQDVKKFLNVGKVQPDRRLVKYIERVCCSSSSQLARKFYPLRLAPRQRRGRLSQEDVTQTYIGKKLQPGPDGRNVLKKSQRLGTVISSTSAMLFSLYLISSVSRLWTVFPCMHRRSRKHREESASQSWSGRFPRRTRTSPPWH